jgi:hypothetical protein
MVAIVNRGGGGPQTSGERGSNKAPRSFWGRLLKAIHDYVKRERYEPARYYMRGPGPASSKRSRRTEGHGE